MAVYWNYNHQRYSTIIGDGRSNDDSSNSSSSNNNNNNNNY